MAPPTIGWTISQWREAQVASTQEEAIKRVIDLVAYFDKSDPAWITIATPEQINAQFDTLAQSGTVPKVNWSIGLFMYAFASKGDLINGRTERLVSERRDQAEFPALAKRPISTSLISLDSNCDANVPLQDLPLFGVPFAPKDNIDAATFPTTAACPAYLYEPEKDATIVAILKAAGAIVVGKPNLDQFACSIALRKDTIGIL
ncbi:amidase signature domain-containing protein [Lipomyces tetrasporus]